MSLNKQQFGEQLPMFDALYKEGSIGPEEVSEHPSMHVSGGPKALDMAYWMNNANPNEHYTVHQ
jgi:hypothetical protein